MNTHVVTDRLTQRRRTRLVPWLLYLAVLATGTTYAYLTDGGIHAPPTSGTFAYNTFKPGAAGFPAVGNAYIDPVFGSTVKRLTNVTGNVNLEDIYAKHQANANGTLAFHTNANGVHVINVNTGAIVYPSQPAGLSNFEMHWDANDPDKYYFFSGRNLMRRNLAAQTSTPMNSVPFPTNLQVNGGSLNIQSRDGRYFTLRYGGTNKVWDSLTQTTYTGSVTPLDSGGWVSITPDAKYIVTAAGSTPEPQKQHHSYPINHATQSIGSTPTQFWGLCGDHGVLVSASDGKNYFVTFECFNVGAIYRVDITLNQAGRTELQQVNSNQKLVQMTWNDDGHFSAVSKGPLADWVFMSTESTVDNFNSGVSGWTAYKQEILAMNVVTLEVRRLAHHRSRAPLTVYGYQPRVSTSWDGSVVMWTSNFNTNSPSGYSDLYAIQSPLGATSSNIPAPANLRFK